MRLVELTALDLVETSKDRQRFPVWIDADRVTSIRTNFHWETWAGRTYARADGACIQLGSEDVVIVAEDVAAVVEKVAP